MIEEVEYAGWRSFGDWFGPVPVIRDIIPGEVDSIPTGSGRAALRIILEYLKSRGVLADKNAEVLIPRWLCMSVVQTLHRFCHPVLTPSKNIKAVLAYHQYGFPQDMDAVSRECACRGAFLIEDCANTFGGMYRGRRLGTIADAAIFSFSKLFPSVLGGALASGNAELMAWGRKRLGQTRYSGLVYGGRFLYEILRGTSFAAVGCDIQEMTYAKTDGAFAIRGQSLRAVGRELRCGAIDRRVRNYSFIVRFFADRPEYFSGLERDGVVPYVVPLFDRADRLEKIAAALRAHGIATGVYHFDVNRNVFEPRFEKCVWVPVHQGIDPACLETICSVIKGAA